MVFQRLKVVRSVICGQDQLDLTRASIAALLLRCRRLALGGKLLPAKALAALKPNRCRPASATDHPRSPPQACPDNPPRMLMPSTLASTTSRDRESASLREFPTIQRGEKPLQATLKCAPTKNAGTEASRHILACHQARHCPSEYRPMAAMRT